MQSCGSTCLDLIATPTIHAQRFDLRDVGTQLAVQRSTSYAEKYSQLGHRKQDIRGVQTVRAPLTLQLAHPDQRLAICQTCKGQLLAYLDFEYCNRRNGHSPAPS